MNVEFFTTRGKRVKVQPLYLNSSLRDYRKVRNKMNINKSFKILDKVSGLEISIVEGKTLDHLKIKHIGKPICKNRDFWFTKEGEFDGTGSILMQT